MPENPYTKETLMYGPEADTSEGKYMTDHAGPRDYVENWEE